METLTEPFERHIADFLRRARWSLTLRFTLLDAIPSELVVYNPMGSSVI